MTTEHAEKQNVTAAPTRAAADTPNAQSARAEDVFADDAAHHKPKRTLGLKLFDNFAYTLFINTTVFVASTLMTYMTKHGQSFGAEGSNMRAVGVWFNERSRPINNFFKRIGVKSEKARSDFTSVVWSFLDGTIFSFLAKPLEDKREKIAMKIDDVLGTSPDNMRAYDAEPKQSWRSIVEGRFLTFLLVAPTAWLMTRIGGNQRAFLEPGFKFASTVEKHFPKIGNWLSKKSISTAQQKGDFFGYVFFEAFYTSVCTAGLYLMSRMVARRHPKQEHHQSTNPVPASNDTNARDEATPNVTPETPQKPAASITQPTLIERVSHPAHANEVTA